jgi:hypothetical protein
MADKIHLRPSQLLGTSDAVLVLLQHLLVLENTNKPLLTKK